MLNSILKRLYHKIQQVFGVEIRRVKRNDLESKEIKRIKKIPPGTLFETSLLGKPVKANHRGSFLFLYREIFKEGAYQFKASGRQPFIIDCGVNIGLSIIYFKQQFPGAEVVGFEPDETLFLIAQDNLRSTGITDVNLIMKGVWKDEGRITFSAEGTDAGRIAKDGDIVNLKSIETVRLSDYITKPVDFLKIDIEGAELAVLEECESKLHLIKQLFVEYHSFSNEKQQLSKLLSILENTGFRHSISSPKIINSKPLVSKENYLGMDYLLNIYAWRSETV